MSIENSNSHTEITADSLIKRAFLSIEDGDFDDADGFLEKALNLDPEKADIYIGKLMIEKRVHNSDELSALTISLDDEKLFQRALRFANENEKPHLEEYANKNRLNLERIHREKLEKAKALLKRVLIAIEDDDFDEAALLIQPVLTQYPENSDAYLAKLMINKKVHSPDELTKLATPLENEELFKLALRFANDDEKIKLNEYARINNAEIERKEQEEQAELERRYLKAIELKDRAETFEDFNGLIAELKAIAPYKDTESLLNEANASLIKMHNLETKYESALQRMKNAKPSGAIELNNLIEIFNSLGSYKDAANLADEAKNILEQRYNEALKLKEKAETSDLQALQALIDKLEPLVSYKDADVMLKEALDKKELEEKYVKALEIKEQAKTLKDFESLIAAFEALGDYKKSKSLLEEVRPVYESLKKAATRARNICIASFLITAITAGSAWYYYKSQKEKEIREAYTAAQNYYSQGNYEQAVKKYSLAADNGNVDAQYRLGLAYDTGQGVSKDYAAAVNWLIKAAEKGNADAQYRVGLRYANGEGVKQDYHEAVSWLIKAIDNGNHDASAELKRIGKAVPEIAPKAYNYARSYYDAKKYKEAAEEYRIAAELGKANAQFNLGVMYYNGDGVKQSYENAIKWYKMAADQGDILAQKRLGEFYYWGRGDIKRDYNEAAKWYRKAAELGDTEAQARLGYLYASGYGVKQDYQEAIQWYTKAADHNNNLAQYYLGTMYENGNGFKQDYKKAAEFYRRSAENDGASAPYALGLLYEKGLGVPQSYAQAAEWYNKSTDWDERARERLDLLKKEGKIDKDWLPIQEAKRKANSAYSSQNYYEAAKFYRVAAEQGDADSQYWLGWLYDQGQGISQNFYEAAKWYRKAAEQGEAFAQNNLGTLYYRGNGVAQDYREAAKWFNKSAEQSNSYAQNWLGILYERGHGVKQDFKRAVELYRKSAEQGDEYGQYDLGLMYENGKGVKQDYNKAIEWYRKAAAQGDEDAKKRLNALERKKSPAVLDEPSDVQVNKLIAQNKIPLYIRDSGNFFYNPNMQRVRITGDNVRLRSQPNMNSNVLARGDREMSATIDYLGEWTHPNGDKWIVGLYDGHENYPYTTPEWEKKVIWVSARFAIPITFF